MAQVNHPSNLMDRIVRLEQELAEVRKKVGLSSATISRGGLTIQEGGYLQIVDPDGDELFYVGALSGTPRPDGSPQQATVIQDDRSAARIFVWDPDPNSGGYRQYVAITDYSGNIVLSDDVDSGQGLARPYLPLPVAPTRYVDFLQSTSDTYERIYELRPHKQHPYTELVLRVAADQSTTGEWRLLINGTEETSGSIPDGTFDLFDLRFAMPGNHMDVVAIEIEIRRTSGTGSVGAVVREAYGVQS